MESPTPFQDLGYRLQLIGWKTSLLEGPRVHGTLSSKVSAIRFRAVLRAVRRAQLARRCTGHALRFSMLFRSRTVALHEMSYGIADAAMVVASVLCAPGLIWAGRVSWALDMVGTFSARNRAQTRKIRNIGIKRTIGLRAGEGVFASGQGRGR